MVLGEGKRERWRGSSFQFNHNPSNQAIGIQVFFPAAGHLLLEYCNI